MAPCATWNVSLYITRRRVHLPIPAPYDLLFLAFGKFSTEQLPSATNALKLHVLE